MRLPIAAGSCTADIMAAIRPTPIIFKPLFSNRSVKGYAMKLLIVAAVAALSLAACGSTHTERTWDKSARTSRRGLGKTQADLNAAGKGRVQANWQQMRDNLRNGNAGKPNASIK